MGNIDFLGFVIEVGFSVVKDKMKDKKDEIKIKDRLREYIERQKKINFTCSIDEEIDFEGLACYIQNELIDDFKKRIKGTILERRSARRNIINKAVTYAQANSNLSRKRTIKMIDTVMNILREYYNNSSNWELKFLLSEVEDSLSEEFQKGAKNTASTIIESESRIIAAISEENNMSLTKNQKLLSEGKTEEVKSNIKNYINALGVVHDLYPYYTFAIDDDRIYSKPLSKEALKKYPPRITGTAYVKMGDKHLSYLDDEIIDYANRHQLEITIDWVTAKGLLGEFEDPAQDVSKEWIGKRTVIPPKPFPPAFPCNVSINDTVIIDYLLLRTEKQLDDGTIVISNKEQKEFPIRITMSINLQTKHGDYKLSLIEQTNENAVKYLRVLKALSDGGTMVIKALAIDQEICRSNVDGIQRENDYLTVDEELALVENVVAIEKYFDKSILIPSELQNRDIEIIDLYAALIRGESRQCKWDNLKLPITASEDFKAKMESDDNSTLPRWLLTSITTSIFDEEYTLPVAIDYGNVKYKDLEKFKQKVALADEGDKVNLELLPENGETGTYTIYPNFEKE